jgi:twitching motility two-component system response regulator PilH
MSKILLVEDNTNHRNLIAKILKTEGYTITTAADGSEALDQVRADCPDLIISDIMMPRFDGIQMVKALRGMPECNSVPILMMTAYVDIIEEAINAGANRALGKPFDFECFLTTIKELIN